MNFDGKVRPSSGVLRYINYGSKHKSKIQMYQLSTEQCLKNHLITVEGLAKQRMMDLVVEILGIKTQCLRGPSHDMTSLLLL